MLKTFFKYQSLGNDFIVFDWLSQPVEKIIQQLSMQNWIFFVRKVCARNTGIGANNVLILKQNIEESIPEVVVFNADGSKAETCLNGLRSVALHLLSFHDFPSNFSSKIGKNLVWCEAIFHGTSEKKNIDIITKIKKISFLGNRTIIAENKVFQGHLVNTGNPHFVIFKKVTIDWLRKYGKLLEGHSAFERGTNVEFVWKDFFQISYSQQKNYQLLVYERGCGITQSCGSGAASGGATPSLPKTCCTTSPTSSSPTVSSA